MDTGQTLLATTVAVPHIASQRSTLASCFTLLPVDGISKATLLMLVVSGDALLGKPPTCLWDLSPPTQLRSKNLLTLQMSGGILKEPSDHCML